MSLLSSLSWLFSTRLQRPEKPAAMQSSDGALRAPPPLPVAAKKPRLRPRTTKNSPPRVFSAGSMSPLAEALLYSSTPVITGASYESAFGSDPLSCPAALARTAKPLPTPAADLQRMAT